MARGKTIQLYLMDGTPKGRIKCTLANWTGITYKIPRTELNKAKTIDHFKQSGVYFLFGTSDETQENIVYFGQGRNRKNGEGILFRLQEDRRAPDKDYWTEAVIITTINNTLGPTEISFLENQFYRLAVDSKRYIVKNKVDPSLGNVTEEKQAELEDFIDYAKIVIGALGYRVFEPIIEPTLTTDSIPIIDNEPILTLTFKPRNEPTITASGKQTSEGFVVLKGSNIRQEPTSSASKANEKNRKKAVLDENYCLLDDMLFNSPSAAASFVKGQSANGREDWKDENGHSLNELERSND